MYSEDFEDSIFDVSPEQELDWAIHNDHATDNEDPIDDEGLVDYYTGAFFHDDEDFDCFMQELYDAEAEAHEDYYQPFGEAYYYERHGML